jgi:NAD(P)-dependent dehydrogenase (short-subunit alcohol dehydrogenase family)
MPSSFLFRFRFRFRFHLAKPTFIAAHRAMALDHAHEGIRINAVCPGDTFVTRWVDRDRERVRATRHAQVQAKPQRR